METLIRPAQYFEYNRERALEYAHRWAFGRNPAYFNYENLGGDCTNFISQIVYAGTGIMNYSQNNGWYYASGSKHSASWTAVNYFRNFILNNQGNGPFAQLVDVSQLVLGDLIQLAFITPGVFQHNLCVVQAGDPPDIDNILIACHTYDRDYYALTNYRWVDIRFIHILGARRV